MLLVWKKNSLGSFVYSTIEMSFAARISGKLKGIFSKNNMILIKLILLVLHSDTELPDYFPV